MVASASVGLSSAGIVESLLVLPCQACSGAVAELGSGDWVDRLTAVSRRTTTGRKIRTVIATREGLDAAASPTSCRLLVSVARQCFGAAASAGASLCLCHLLGWLTRMCKQQGAVYSHGREPRRI